MPPVAESPATFGGRLRLARTRAGVSLGRLAELVRYSKGHLGNVEAGAKQPSADLAKRLEGVLGLRGELVSMVPASAAGPSAGSAPSGLGDQWTLRLAADGHLEFTARDPSEQDSTVAWSVGAPISAPPPGGMAVFGGLLAEARRMGQVLPPAAMIQLLVPQANTVRAAALAAAGRDREDGFRLAARLVEYIGWMAQESGDDRAAAWWTDQSVALARAAGDEELVTYALVRHAELALYQENFADVLAYAQRAQTPRASRRLRELATQREAQGYALAGDETAALGALDRARELAATAECGIPLGSSAPGNMAFVTAWTLHELGRYREAADALAVEYANVSPDSHRVRARFGARLALSTACLDELEAACAIAEPVLAVINGVDSATARADLRSLYRALNRVRGHPRVRGLLPSFAEALRSAKTRTRR